MAVVVVTAVAEVTGVDAATIGTLPTQPARAGAAGPGQPRGLLAPAAVVAFLAALESLLSARVADGMTDAPRSDADRELFGQGLANIASGVCGGMPATGAIARTAVNARAGARTRVASLTHAVVLAAVVYTASGLVGHIPLVALAGVLLVTAWRMVERHNVRAVLGSTRGDALVFGSHRGRHGRARPRRRGRRRDGPRGRRRGRADGRHRAGRAGGGDQHAEIDDDEEQALLARHVLAYRLDGPLFFAAVSRFLAEMTATADVRVVILRLSAVALLDASGARALGEVVEDLEERGITVLIKGASVEHLRLLDAVGTLRPLVERGHVSSRACPRRSRTPSPTSPCAPLGDGGAHRDVGLELRPLGRRPVPARHAAARPAGALRRALRHRRAQRQLLPLAPRRELRELAAPAARRGSSCR